MKRHLISIFYVCLVLATSPVHGLTVKEAIDGGYVDLSARSSSGYSEVTLVLQKKRAVQFSIDFSTAYFIQSNASQRVGLTYEKSSGAYHLRFPQGVGNYTLVFDARCLDHNRPSPTTEMRFARYAIFGAEFNAIVRALRSNASQSNIWYLTDDSGALADRWKAADSRSAPAIDSYLDMTRPASWQSSGNSVRIRLARLSNTSDTWTTGSLRLRVWATRNRFWPGSGAGYVLGELRLAPLRPGYGYPNISRLVSFHRAPAGSYYTTMTVEEYSGSGTWQIRDFVTFQGRTRF